MTMHGVAKPVYRAFELMHNYTQAQQLAVQVAQPAGKPCFAAFATAAAAGDVGTLAVFVGSWNHAPDAQPNRTVTVQVTHAANAGPSAATAYLIGGAYANPRALWEQMGSPDVPSASQLAQLQAASQVGVQPLACRASSATVTEIDLPAPMANNTAAAIVFQK